MVTLFTNVANLLLFLSSLSFLLLVNPKEIRFSTDLIHRDSLLSPFHKPNMTWYEHYLDVVQRSYNHANRLGKAISANDYPYSIISSHGDYLMRIQLGTNYHQMLVLVDSGSDLLWVQCEPCNNLECTYLNYPRFVPAMSGTYRTLRCSDPRCTALPYTRCDMSRDTCVYTYTYEGGPDTEGDLAYETISFPSTDGTTYSYFNDVIIGCSIANHYVYSDNMGGVVGLSMNMPSLFKQIEQYVDRTFSYCLPSWRDNDGEVGKIIFGPSNVVGPDLITTRLYDRDGLYFLNLLAIIIGDSRFDYPEFGFQVGNINIDSGSPNTLLPEIYYSVIANEMHNLLVTAGAQQIQHVHDMCYQTLEAIETPTVIIVFEGAYVVLDDQNVFRNYGDASCFTFHPTNSQPTYGGVTQENFWVEYSLERMTLSFKKTDCILA